jgi:hypothetical protein
MGASGALTLRGPAPGGALNSPSPPAAAPAPRAPGSVDRALREVAAALGPPPHAADPPAPLENGVVATLRHLAAAMLGPLISPGSHFLELLIVVDAPGFSSLQLPDAVQRVVYTPARPPGRLLWGSRAGQISSGL